MGEYNGVIEPVRAVCVRWSRLYSHVRVADNRFNGATKGMMQYILGQSGEEEAFQPTGLAMSPLLTRQNENARAINHTEHSPILVHQEDWIASRMARLVICHVSFELEAYIRLSLLGIPLIQKYCAQLNQASLLAFELKYKLKSRLRSNCGHRFFEVP